MSINIPLSCKQHLTIATKSTLETCVGVVKAPPVHCKNPPQHYSDLVMLSNTACLQPVFINPLTGLNKEINCIRVDGATDEGPSHEAVQFWWTLWHFTQKKVATLVTTRSSRSSYLNRVELQNGCLSLGHSNTFIPSTLVGSCFNEETGTINQSKLKENLNMAISAYISRVDGCPCGDSIIKLFRGCDSQENQEKNEKLSIFLKGSKRAKEKLKSDNPHVYDHFQTVWEIRNRHLVHGIPSSYVFYLRCCYQSDCKHRACQLGKPQEMITWFPNGAPITHLPFPILDEMRPGHYTTKMFDTENEGELKEIIKPPSVVLKEQFSESGGLITEGSLQSISKNVNLTVEEVSIWFDHLKAVLKNHQRRAKKAAETRRRRKQIAGQAKQVSGNEGEKRNDKGQDREQDEVNQGGDRMETDQEQEIAGQAKQVSGNEGEKRNDKGQDREQDEVNQGKNGMETDQEQERVQEQEAQDGDDRFCGSCGKDYFNSSSNDDGNFWVGCDLCDRWYCAPCEGLLQGPTADTYFCTNCLAS